MDGVFELEAPELSGGGSASLLCSVESVCCFFLGLFLRLFFGEGLATGRDEGGAAAMIGSVVSSDLTLVSSRFP